MDNKTAVVTGGGSGVGQATAVALARSGWNVAVFGRREAALAETIALAGEAGARMLACVCDVGDKAQVMAAAPQWFSDLPESALEVRAVEPWREATASIAPDVCGG